MPDVSTAPHPSNPLYERDPEVHGAPRLVALEGHWGDPQVDWKGLNNPAEQRAREIEREQLAAQAKAHRAKSRTVKAAKR